MIFFGRTNLFYKFMTDDCDANWIEHLLPKSDLAWQSYAKNIGSSIYIIRSRTQLFFVIM